MGQSPISAESLVEGFLGPSGEGSDDDSDRARSVIDQFLGTQTSVSDEEFILGEPLRGAIRGGLAFWGDTAAEKYRHFKKSHPEGEIVRNPKDKELYYRLGREGSFQKIDPSMLGDPGGWRDLPLDLLEFAAEEAPIAAGEIAAFGLLRRPPVSTVARARTLLGDLLSRATTRPPALGEKAGWLENTLRAATGAFVGESGRQLAQTVAGTQNQPLADQLARASTMAAFSAGGEFATKPIIQGVKALKGIPIAKVIERVKPALRAEKRFRLPHLTPGQTVINPILARWERMGRTISTAMITHFDKQIKQARRTWDTLITSNANPNAITENISRAVDDAESNIWKGANVRWRSLDSAGTGEQILKGVMRWNKLARNAVNRLYDDARAVETPVYQITNLKTLTDEVKAGVRYSAPPEDVPTGVLDVTGREITRKETRDRRLSQQLNEAVRDVIETIQNLNPDLPSVTHPGGRIDDATEQLKTLRQTLYDIKTPTPGDVPRHEQRDAARLYNELSKVMRNPILDTEDGAKLWETAAKAAEKRYMKLDKMIIAQILKTDVKGGASQLARSIIRNGKQSDLLDLRSVMTATDFLHISNFAAAQIFEKPSLLKSMDKDVLKVLFRKTDLDNIRATVDDFKRIRKLGVGLTKAFADNSVQRKGLTKFLLGATPRQMDEFIETMQGQPESIDLIRKTILDGIGEAAIVQEAFDVRRFLGVYYKLDDAGLFQAGKLFTKDQLENIKDLRRYIEVASGVSQKDAGTSLMAAEAVSPTALATQGGAAIPGMLHKILLIGGFGRLVTSPMFSKLVRGRYRKVPGPGMAGWDSAFLRGMAATIAASLGQSSEEETE
jgi:hypothetical protein